MHVLDHLVSSIDNGGQRAYVKRRCNLQLRVIPERRARQDRRKIVDRRRVANARRMAGPERRVFLN
jgi:hypothetical protein